MAAPFSEDGMEMAAAAKTQSLRLIAQDAAEYVRTQSRRVGLLIGLMLQCSLLGLYFGAPFMSLDTSQMSCPRVLALVWSIALCFMGYVILQTLRSLVVAVLEVQAQRDQQMLSDEEDQQQPQTFLSASSTTPLIQSTLQSVLNGAIVGVGVTSLLVMVGAVALFQTTNQADGATTTASTAIIFNEKPWLVCGILRDATLVLLAAAIVWLAWTTLRAAFTRHQPPCSDHDMTRPLLPIDNSTHVTTTACDQQLQVEQERQAPPVSGRRKMWHLQLSSLLFGSLVGWLIQCTSLSANLLVVYYHHVTMYPQHQQQQHYDDEASPPSSRRWIMAASLALSFVASCLGIALLLLVRALLIQIVTCLVQTSSSKTMAVLDLQPKSRFRQEGLSVPHVNTLFHVECWLAVGTVLGLNVAWTITEYAMSMKETHWVQSGWILLGTTAWCQTVLYCCGYHSAPKRQSSATLLRPEIPVQSPETLSL